MKGRRIALSLLPLALACLGPSPACSETCTKQFVDVGTSSGPSTSLGLIQGYPVISYFGASRKLKYAYLNPENKTWYLQTVDAGGEFTSLATDSLGIVHVGYINAVTMHLNYWRNNQGRVEIQLIDSESGQGGMGFYNSIQVDAQGRPRISYFRARSPDGSLSSDLKYAEVNGSTWTTEFVDTTGERGKYNSLALDGSGNPQIAYRSSATSTRPRSRSRSPMGIIPIRTGTEYRTCSTSARPIRTATRMGRSTGGRGGSWRRPRDLPWECPATSPFLGAGASRRRGARPPPEEPRRPICCSS